MTKNLQAGLQIISQLTPQELSLNASGFPAGENDGLLFWDPVAQRYMNEINYFTGAWYDADLNEVQPTPKLGEAVFYKKFAAGTATWTRNFDVRP